MKLNSFSEIELLRDAHIRVNERWRKKVIAAAVKIDSVEAVVAINLRRFCGKRSVVMKATLRAGRLSQTLGPE